jgi:uncharacterized protein YjiS (DUF1127 family)
MSVRTIETRTVGCAGRAPQSSLTARIGALARRGWQTYWQRRARRATVLLLASLDDRTLHDIGLSPSEIASVVYGSPDRLRRYQAGCPLRGPTRPQA